MKVLYSEPNDPRWPDDGSVAAGSQAHVEAGLWAFDTCNGNAWEGLSQYLERSAADAVLGQEAKVEKVYCSDVEDRLALQGWKAALQPCVYGDNGGKSSGTLVAVRSHLGMRNTDFDDSEWPQLAGRYSMKWLGAVCKGGIGLGSCYLHSKIGVGAKLNLDLLHAIGAALSRAGERWILAGDFNCTPEQLRATGWLKVVKGRTVEASASTCGDRKLDYFVVSEGLWPAVRSAHVIGDSGCKTHKPVRLLLRANPRALLTRTLNPPKGFAAELPHGPPIKPVCGQWSCDPNDTEGCFKAIEEELSRVCWHDVATAEKHAGRAEGPKFQWKTAISPVSDERAKTTSASRAWRRRLTGSATSASQRRRRRDWQLSGSSSGTRTRGRTLRERQRHNSRRCKLSSTGEGQLPTACCKLSQ